MTIATPGAGAEIARASLAPADPRNKRQADYQHPQDAFSALDRALIGSDGVRFTVYLLDRSQLRRDLAQLERAIVEARLWLDKLDIPDRSAMMASRTILTATRKSLDRRRTSRVKATDG